MKAWNRDGDTDHESAPRQKHMENEVAELRRRPYVFLYALGTEAAQARPAEKRTVRQDVTGVRDAAVSRRSHCFGSPVKNSRLASALRNGAPESDSFLKDTSFVEHLSAKSTQQISSSQWESDIPRKVVWARGVVQSTEKRKRRARKTLFSKIGGLNVAERVECAFFRKNRG